jgi:hypothetical protein
MEIISTGVGRRVKMFLVTTSTDFGSDHVDKNENDPIWNPWETLPNR